jgi:hypothetical protein
MIKRNCIVVFLLFAFTVVLAHSIVPHHHHNIAVHNENETSEHDDENSLEHSFEHYTHTGTSGDYFIPSSSNHITHDIVNIELYFPKFTFTNKEVILYTISFVHSNDCSFISFDSLHSKGLRGPPQV